MAALAVALLALGLVMALPSSDGLAQEVERAEARLRLDRAAVTAESRVTFLVLTEPAGRSGLELGGPRLAADGSLVSADPSTERRTLLFDGRPYRFPLDGGGEAIIRVQDAAGLVNVAEGNRPLLASMMQTCGVSPLRAREVADAMALARPAQRAQGDPSLAAIPYALRWDGYVRGSIRRRLQAASSFQPGVAGVNLATAPPTVLMALYRDSRTVDAQLRARDKINETTNMSIKYNHIEYKPSLSVITRQMMGNKLVITVEFVSPKLTQDLPLYFYRASLNANDFDQFRAFSAEGSIVNVGRYAECYPHLERPAELFPER